jgi:hypothetical protein
VLPPVPLVPVPDVLVGVTAVSNDEIPLLIEINCSRLFTSVNCVMYSFGSVGCVGSWFCSSLTSNVRKSLLVIVAPPEAALELELEVPVVLPVESAATGLAVRGVPIALLKFEVAPFLGASDVPTICAAATCPACVFANKLVSMLFSFFPTLRVPKSCRSRCTPDAATTCAIIGNRSRLHV